MIEQNTFKQAASLLPPLSEMRGVTPEERDSMNKHLKEISERLYTKADVLDILKKIKKSIDDEMTIKESLNIINNMINQIEKDEYKGESLFGSLIVSDAVKNGIEGTKLADMSYQDSLEYKELVKEANENIKKTQREQAEALIKANDYISD